MMRRDAGRILVLACAFTLVAAACSGDDGAASTTTTTAADGSSTTSSTSPDATTTTSASATTTTTTTTTVATGPPVAVQGDANETVEALQFLLNCGGFGDLEVDGVFGPATLAAVEAAQADLGRAVDGAPDDETFAELSRACGERRRLPGDGLVTVVGNAAPGDPEELSVALLSGSTLTIAITQGTGIAVTVTGADGGDIVSRGEGIWEVETTQDYVIGIGADEPTTFALEVEVTAAVRETGDWILATDGVTYRGTKLALGEDAQTVIDQVFEFLGHGVRGAYDEFDTGWYPITEPQDLGLRGIFVEGFAFLFYGPDPNHPDRPETFERHRFVGPSVDASGNPRPDNYATTAEGITVGDTLADLKAAYGDRVRPGSNSDEFYYRLGGSNGELCFYFDMPDEPSEFSPITEIASECRTG